jgi:tetratricopeptide (TPR) repeat protein
MGMVVIAALNEVHDRSSENENYLGGNNVWPTVEKMYSNFFAKYPDNIRRRFNYAYHAYKAKKYDVATSQFEMIGDRWMKDTAWRNLELFNNCRAHAYAAYGITLLPDQAVTYLKKSLELNPEEKASYFNLGTFTAKLGQYEEAEKAFLKAIQLNPYDAEAHLRLSWVYGQIRNTPKAKEYAEKALHCSPTEEQKNRAKNYVDFCYKALK